MHAFMREPVEVGCKGRSQGLALTGLLLGDIALMQEDAAQKLSVEGAQAKGTARSLAAVGKGFGQQIVKVLARIANSSVRSLISSSLSFSNSGSSALIRATSGRVALIFRSFGVPKTFLAIVPIPSM